MLSSNDQNANIISWSPMLSVEIMILLHRFINVLFPLSWKAFRDASSFDVLPQHVFSKEAPTLPQSCWPSKNRKGIPCRCSIARQRKEVISAAPCQQWQLLRPHAKSTISSPSKHWFSTYLVSGPLLGDFSLTPTPALQIGQAITTVKERTLKLREA